MERENFNNGRDVHDINTPMQKTSSLPSTIDTSIEDSLTFSSPLDSPYLVPLPYFVEPSSRGGYTASPPIGRTTASGSLSYTQGHSTSSPISSGQNDSSRPRTDSGFSSWAGTAESQQKFFPVLMRIDSEDQQSDLNRYDFNFSAYQAATSSTGLGTMTIADSSKVHGGVNIGPDLSSLPCANALNEELTDRMLVHDFGDMFISASDHWSGKSRSCGKVHEDEARKPRERFKISPNILTNAEKPDQSGVPSAGSNNVVSYTSRPDLSPNLPDPCWTSPRGFVPLRKCSQCVVRRRPDSAPIHVPSRLRQLSLPSDPDPFSTDPGHEGDDENEVTQADSSSRRPLEKRVRRNTHRAFQVLAGRSCTSRVTRITSRPTVPAHGSASSPNHRLIRHGASPRTLMAQKHTRIHGRHHLEEHHVTRDSSPLPSCSRLQIPSIPDVIPRQLCALPTRPALHPGESVSLFYSPLFKLSPAVSRQRSFSFPFGGSQSHSPYSPPPNHGGVHSGRLTFQSLALDAQLSILSSRLAQIGDELAAEYPSIDDPTSSQVLWVRTILWTFSSFWAFVRGFTSVLTALLDCVQHAVESFNRLYHFPPNPVDPSYRSRTHPTRRRTLTHTGIASYSHRTRRHPSIQLTSRGQTHTYMTTLMTHMPYSMHHRVHLTSDRPPDRFNNPDASTTGNTDEVNPVE